MLGITNGTNVVTTSKSGMLDISSLLPSDPTGASVKLTGYSKPASSSAISGTDTVNQAVGKLERSLDDKLSSSYIVSSTAPTDTNKLWIKNGVMYYYDSASTSWKSLLFTTDCSSISIN